MASLPKPRSRRKSGPTNWLLGAAFQADLYRSRAFPGFDYSFIVPGLFGQVEQELSPTDCCLRAAPGSTSTATMARGSVRASRRSITPARGRSAPRWARASTRPPPLSTRSKRRASRASNRSGRSKAETANTASLDFGYAKGPIEAKLHPLSHRTSTMPSSSSMSMPTACASSTPRERRARAAAN